MIKRIVAAVVLLAIALAIVVVVRAAQFTPRQVQVSAAASFTPPSGAVERLAGAIRIPTVSPSDSMQRDSAAFRAMHEYLAHSFPRVYASVTHEVVGRDALLFEWKGSDPSLAPVVLMGHMDVVPVDPPTLALWKHAPFSGDIDSGYVWGRGTRDDKATMMSHLESAEYPLTRGFVPKRTIYFAFGADEEVSGIHGGAEIAKLMQSRGIKPMMVLDEGGTVVNRALPGLAKPVAVVGISEKGYASFALTVRGPGGHSSMPPRHTTAGILARAITRLEDNPLEATLGPEMAQLFDAAGREMSFSRKVLFANRWLLNPVLVRFLASSPSTDAAMRTTTAVTMLEGSPKDNVLPGVSRAVVNFRIVPGETAETVRAHILRVIDDSRVDVTPIGAPWRPSRVSPTNDSVWNVLDKTIRQIYPDAIVAPFMALGATDSRYFRDLTTHVYRFTGTQFDIEDKERVHGTNERIAVKSYLDGIRFSHQLILNLAQ